MRRSPFLLLALLVLAGCQESPSTTAPAATSPNSGGLAMRLSYTMVAATKALADSVILYVIPLTGNYPTLIQSWPLESSELLFESVPAVPCSVRVELVDAQHQIALRGATLVTVKPGRTTSADIGLDLLSGSLDVNLHINTGTNTTPPNLKPAAGTFLDSVVVELPTPIISYTIQYRLENSSTRFGDPWTDANRSDFDKGITIKQSSRLFVRTIAFNDTGAIAIHEYTITKSKSTLFEGFETPVANYPGWNGSLYLNGSGQNGARLANGPWGSGAAQVNNWFSKGGPTYSGAIFEGRPFAPDSAINWARLSKIRIKIRTNNARQIRVELFANSLTGYSDKFGQTVSLVAGKNELVLDTKQFAQPTGSPTGPTLAAVMAKLTGIGVHTICATFDGTSCVDPSGVLEFDDIYVDTF